MKRKYFLNRKTGRMKRLIFFLASFCTIACCQAEGNIVISEGKTFVCQSDTLFYDCSFCKKITIENKDTANIAVWLEKDIPEDRKNNKFYFIIICACHVTDHISLEIMTYGIDCGLTTTDICFYSTYQDILHASLL